jgi:hypothetical protein
LSSQLEEFRLQPFPSPGKRLSGEALCLSTQQLSNPDLGKSHSAYHGQNDDCDRDLKKHGDLLATIWTLTRL